MPVAIAERVLARHLQSALGVVRGTPGPRDLHAPQVRCIEVTFVEQAIRHRIAEAERLRTELAAIGGEVVALVERLRALTAPT